MDNQITRRSNKSLNSRDELITRTRRTVSGQENYDQIEDENEEYTPIQAEPVKYRIGATVTIFMIALAGFFDLFELILSLFSVGIGGYIKDFASIFVFPFLFWAFGVPFWKGNKKVQKLIAMCTGAVISFIPILSDITPELLISVLVTLGYTRIEDKIRSKTAFLKMAETITRRKRG